MKVFGSSSRLPRSCQSLQAIEAESQHPAPQGHHRACGPLGVECCTAICRRLIRRNSRLCYARGCEGQVGICAQAALEASLAVYTLRVGKIPDGEALTEIQKLSTMKGLLMLCDASAATGEAVQPVVTLGLCIRTKKIEPAGRSFLDKYETAAASKRHSKKKSCKRCLLYRNQILASQICMLKALL